MNGRKPLFDLRSTIFQYVSFHFDILPEQKMIIVLTDVDIPQGVRKAFGGTNLKYYFVRRFVEEQQRLLPPNVKFIFADMEKSNSESQERSLRCARIFVL